jgi:urease accessory protein
MNDPKNPVPAPLERGSNSGLYRLLAWLSPGFPIGSFAFSHGLEAAAASGAVRDRDSLQLWLGAILASGGGRVDADIRRDAHRASSAGDIRALMNANRRGAAFRGTAETRFETTAQGDAFLAACRAAWPNPILDCWAERISERGEAVCYAAAVGAATAQAGIALDCALLGYLLALAANLVSAGFAARHYRANRRSAHPRSTGARHCSRSERRVDPRPDLVRQCDLCRRPRLHGS